MDLPRSVFDLLLVRDLSSSGTLTDLLKSIDCRLSAFFEWERLLLLMVAFCCNLILSRLTKLM